MAPWGRVLHAVVRWAAQPTLAVSVEASDVVRVLYRGVFGVSGTAGDRLSTLVAATMLTKVFVIQHTGPQAGGHRVQAG
jgi:hypothetical protein